MPATARLNWRSGSAKRSPSRSAIGRAPIATMSRRIPPTPVAAPWNGSTADGWLCDSTLKATASSVTPGAGGGGCPGATGVKGGSLPRAEDMPRLRSPPVSRPQLISIRRARLDDLDFLFELVNDEEVEPYLGGRASLDRESLL